MLAASPKSSLELLTVAVEEDLVSVLEAALGQAVAVDLVLILA